MLSDIYIPRARPDHQHINLHRHATISCRWSRIIARVKRMFG
ncbi:MAG: hypothetical protein OEL78_06910 [Hyphomicrobiales bacterium]|nr:hypothetical protein [Hyphomicrobiales bacterium]